MRVPEFLYRRLKQTAPTDCNVLEGSTPVLFFGNPVQCGIATLSLNPSKREFIEKGRWLSGDEQRFLHAGDLLSDEQCFKAVDYCKHYFSRNPYRSWFNWIENDAVLPSGASLYDGSACHLDIVQWATNPAWGKLADAEKETLIQHDEWYFRELLNYYRFRLLLLNGKTAARTFFKLLGINEGTVDSQKRYRLTVWSGSVAKLGLRFSGWSIPLHQAINRETRRFLRAYLMDHGRRERKRSG